MIVTNQVPSNHCIRKENVARILFKDFQSTVILLTKGSGTLFITPAYFFLLSHIPKGVIVRISTKMDNFHID